MRKPTRTIPLLIHLFAAAHAVVVVLSRMFNYVDDLPLTILTISLIVIISMRRGVQAELMAALTIIATFVGYAAGIYGAKLIALVVHNHTLAPAITTILVTELIGWATYLFARRKGNAESTAIAWSPSTLHIIAIAAAILLLRITYTLIFDSPYFEQSSIYTEFRRLLGNTMAMTVLLCGNVIFVNLRGSRHYKVVTGLIAVVFSLLVTLVVYYQLPHGNAAAMEWYAFLRLYAVILLVDIVTYTLLKLVSYVISSNAELRDERGAKHRAQYQYNKLKLQINPHFLFNSLNILDFLVQEQQTERASAFIHKLAGTYRYMLKNEDEPLVSLSEELDFAHKYADLLKERFADAFQIEEQIPPEAMRRHVVPCCLQLLIENATKHNMVCPEAPLRIRITAHEDTLTVSNNLQPRISSQASTGMGIKNIRQQYLDLSGRTIAIEKTKTDFCVKLPLL